VCGVEWGSVQAWFRQGTHTVGGRDAVVTFIKQ
jgi:hypothetical protein